MSRSGGAKLTVLVALKTSQRNCRECPSRGRKKRLWTPKSSVMKRWPRSGLRVPELPGRVKSKAFSAS